MTGRFEDERWAYAETHPNGEPPANLAETPTAPAAETTAPKPGRPITGLRDIADYQPNT